MAEPDAAAPGEAGSVARHVGWSLGDGLVADIELVVTDAPVDDETGGAAATVVRDAHGSFLVVRSIRRGSWDCPGGRREPGESLIECAVREVGEETGLRLAPRQLRRVGYERIVVEDPGHWTEERPCVQIFTATLDAVRPPLVPGGDVDGAQWVDPSAFRALCSGLFWWPLVEHAFAV